MFLFGWQVQLDNICKEAGGEDDDDLVAAQAKVS